MTPPALASALAATLPANATGNLLEVGAGRGALLEATCRALPRLHVTAIELDRALARGLASAGHDVFVGDATRKRTWDRLSRQQFDVVVGNPPYAVSDRELDPRHLLDWGLLDSIRGARLDAFFVAESLARLRTGGAGAFILPMTLLTDKVYAGFRRKLVQQFAKLTVIELPSRAFPGAEVRTVICSFSGERNRSCKIRLASGDQDGRVLDEIAVNAREAEHRADFTYHVQIRDLRRRLAGQAFTLAELGAHVVRGSATAQRFAALGVGCLHTTDFPEEGIGRLSFKKDPAELFKTAQAGDIVVPRLGSRCLLRQAIVVRGSTPYTESVYRVRVAKEHRQAVLDCLAGSVGETWRKLHAKGSCAKHLTLSDLLEMPVPI